MDNERFDKLIASICCEIQAGRNFNRAQWRRENRVTDCEMREIIDMATKILVGWCRGPSIAKLEILASSQAPTPEQAQAFVAELWSHINPEPPNHRN